MLPRAVLVPIGLIAALGATVAVAVGVVAGGGGGQDAAAAAAGSGCQLTIDPAALPNGLPRDRFGTAQLAMAALIVGVGRRQSVPPRGWVIAVATAITESGLRNLANPGVPESLRYPHDGVGYDHASVNAFQQQAGLGWGAVRELMVPEYAARTFYRRLVAVPGWQAMDMGAAAQAVQRSAFPDRYDRQLAVAVQLVRVLGKVDDPAALTGCAAAVEPDGVRAMIVRSALRWLGTPYVFDGGDAHGPTVRRYGGCDPIAPCATKGFDCSGLSLYAWAQVGIPLAHYAPTQYHQGRQVPVADAQPGDLLFWATNPSDEASIHHVAIYVGDDRMVEAPQSGEVVTEDPVRHDGELMPMAVSPAVVR